MNRLEASLTPYNYDEHPAVHVELAEPKDAVEFVALLGESWTSTALIGDMTFLLRAQIQDGLAYLEFTDESGCYISIGDPDSPGITDAEFDFYPGSGVPVGEFAEALQEVVLTRQRPKGIQWCDHESVFADYDALAETSEQTNAIQGDQSLRAEEQI